MTLGYTRVRISILVGACLMGSCGSELSEPTRALPEGLGDPCPLNVVNGHQCDRPSLCCTRLDPPEVDGPRACACINGRWWCPAGRSLEDPSEDCLCRSLPTAGTRAEALYFSCR